MLATAHALVQTPDVPTTTARTRIGIVALDLAETLDTHQGESLRAALVALAATDAYAAQDVLTHRPLSRHRTASQSQSLHDLVRASGLRRGMIPIQLGDQLMAAIAQSTAILTREVERVLPEVPIPREPDNHSDQSAAPVGMGGGPNETGLQRHAYVPTPRRPARSAERASELRLL
jgi:hypothetical protein